SHSITRRMFLFGTGFSPSSIMRSQPLHFVSQRLGDAIDIFPVQVLGRPPSWTDELTYEPVAK
ncbi:hypothetical protein L0B82_23100, partial [Mycobacterium intracellulare subsp. intracellulare]|nr:hypothetical protein [Mycobacterium intracellulare subsp. intracellulare]MDS0337163.1 hypothetical protein [Mycobacterium intracellulare]